MEPILLVTVCGRRCRTGSGALPAGRARVATERDREDVARWYDDFSRAIGEAPSQDPRLWADTRITYGGILFWETPDGTPSPSSA